jgi:hypothetical protein
MLSEQNQQGDKYGFEKLRYLLMKITYKISLISAIDFKREKIHFRV